MRTTVSINDALLKKAKEVSLKRNCTLSEVVEDSLRIALFTKQVAEPPNKVSFKTFAGQGVQPGVQINSNSALEDIMEGK